MGHRYPAYRYEVSREKIREYALATGVTDPAYTDDTDDTADVVAPPTFAACFTVVRGGEAMFADPELGAHPRLVHGGQEFEWHGALRPGDVVECTPWIADIVARRGNDFVTLQIDCVDAATGEPVVTSRGTLVFLAPPAEEPS
ncbi:MAG: MaoC family dehydratase N-terminal domain-containing protein [Egibacteraceae bacterium]